MNDINSSTLKLAARITLITVVFTIVVGALFVFLQMRPFWVDEWFIMHNLKTRDAHALWGQLDFMQQFPRTYLVLFGFITSFLNYSYLSLRLPSYLISICTIVLAYRLMRKLFDDRSPMRYLFVLLLISSCTYTEYFVQAKQYSMDILLSVLAIWQLTQLRRTGSNQTPSAAGYLLLCASFVVFPFFSYTYVLAALPVYMAVCLQSIKPAQTNETSTKITRRMILPLALGIISLCVFYITDIRQLSEDKEMYRFWNFLLPDDRNIVTSSLIAFYRMFAQLGAGLIFEHLIGILGVLSFMFGIVFCLRNYSKKNEGQQWLLTAYSCLVLLLAFTMFLCHKLPLNTPRLTAFTTPSVAILIILFWERTSTRIQVPIQKVLLPVILCLGLSGNVFATYITYFTDEKTQKQLAIYRATEDAILQAQSKNIPLFVTTGICYPYETAVATSGGADGAAWVLRTFPAYSMKQHLQVYSVRNMAEARQLLEQMPPGVTAAIAGDGITFSMIHKQNKP